MTHRTIQPSVLYVGTPVYLVATRNPDGTANIAPASSHFALGTTIVLGLEDGGQSLDNLRRHPELTVNFVAADQWVHVERLAGVTGRNPVPEHKAGYQFEPDKFARAGLTAVPADIVAVPVVAEAPIQLEARLARLTPSVDGVFSLVEAQVVRVHADETITVPGTDHLDPHAWHPLIYAYRHFFDRGSEVGWTRKSPFFTLPAEVDAWEREGGTWKVVAASSTEATIELYREGQTEPARVLESKEPAVVRWANVQAAIAG